MQGYFNGALFQLLLLLQASAYILNATAFTAFETFRKLNSVCCNYQHISLQSLVMSLKKHFSVY